MDCENIIKNAIQENIRLKDENRKMRCEIDRLNYVIRQIGDDNRKMNNHITNITKRVDFAQDFPLKLDDNVRKIEIINGLGRWVVEDCSYLGYIGCHITIYAPFIDGREKEEIRADGLEMVSTDPQLLKYENKYYGKDENTTYEFIDIILHKFFIK